MACSKCGGDYVVGEGGSLECGRCGHIVGDISLLFSGNPSEDLEQCPQYDDKVREGYISEPQKDVRELV